MLEAAVVGARRRHQGTGEYVARDLAGAGCAVTAIVGTSPGTVAEARENLAERYDIDCRGYLSLEELLGEEDPDIVAICSPTRHHRAHLETALAHERHVLCEKPLWWEPALLGTPGAREQVRETTARIAGGFARAGRRLETVTQWPETLDAHRELFGEIDGRPERFAMRLSPTSRGAAMVEASASHPISMLVALCGTGRIEEVRGTWGDDRGRLDLEFAYVHEAGRTAVEVRLERCPEAPRPAGYGVDGRWMERRIAMPGYRISFEADGRSVAVTDPLARLVGAYCRSVERGEPTEVDRLVAEMRLFHDLVEAAHRLEEACGPTTREVTT